MGGVLFGSAEEVIDVGTSVQAADARREPFLPEENASVAGSRKRSKPHRNHQLQEETIASGISSKILKEALIQQREI
ncbi:unnamed protein product [Linum tenue]|uniref:Uncharacterized protein n=1 Tax=Linum tenue TaxID=586396 RepID=A0AAV0RMQ3_9ROSI|nr:unnamed protein product [Linum tenue]